MLRTDRRKKQVELGEDDMSGPASAEMPGAAGIPTERN
jgi:hypothetical protein